MALGKQPLPEDPVARAAVERLARRFKVKKGQDDNAPMEPAIPLTDLLAPDEIRALRNGTPDQKRDIVASIPEDRMDDVVIAMRASDAQSVDGRHCRSSAAPYQLMLANQPQGVVFYDLAEAKLYRAILSNRQLSEEMADFWIQPLQRAYLDKGPDRFMVTSYDRDAIRPHVLGRFRDLLEATATSPAMMFYLDNWESVAPSTTAARKQKSKPASKRGARTKITRVS